ncbi:hypothetical protein [Streptomyces sp. YS-3]|uniref:hypothetical protein n=1 Tax=Streptomyces sp. YS-3 TaxID=3381352 RepID=UPI003862C78E
MSTDHALGPTRSEDIGITTGVLAQRLGVSPVTIRSWDRRYGSAPRGTRVAGTAAGERGTSPWSSRCAG